MGKRTKRVGRRQAGPPATPNLECPGEAFWHWLTHNGHIRRDEPKGHALDFGVILGIWLGQRHPQLAEWYREDNIEDSEAMSQAESIEAFVEATDALAELLSIYQNGHLPHVCADCGGPVIGPNTSHGPHGDW